MAAAVLISYLAAERPFSLALVESQCENAQQQYYDARERARIDQQQNPTAQNDSAAEKRNHADVCAQKRMADAAEAGFWLLLFSLLAAIGAAVAGWTTVRVMRDTARREMRAYVFAKPGSIRFNGRMLVRLDFTVRNAGQTPAYNVHAQFAFLPRPYPLPPGFDPGTPTHEETTNAFGPGDERPYKRELGRPLDPKVEADLRAGTHRYYAVGLITYYDVFREKIRTTRVCASVPGEQILAGIAGPATSYDIEWDYTDEHNDAD